MSIGNRGNYHPRTDEWKSSQSQKLKEHYAKITPEKRREMGKRVLEGKRQKRKADAELARWQAEGEKK